MHLLWGHLLSNLFHMLHQFHVISLQLLKAIDFLLRHHQKVMSCLKEEYALLAVITASPRRIQRLACPSVLGWMIQQKSTDISLLVINGLGTTPTGQARALFRDKPPTHDWPTRTIFTFGYLSLITTTWSSSNTFEFGSFILANKPNCHVPFAVLVLVLASFFFGGGWS